MNSKWHLCLSFLKSLVRIAGCVSAIMFNSWIDMVVGFLIAEVLGVLEEIKDER